MQPAGGEARVAAEAEEVVALWREVLDACCVAAETWGAREAEALRAVQALEHAAHDWGGARGAVARALMGATRGACAGNAPLRAGLGLVRALPPSVVNARAGAQPRHAPRPARPSAALSAALPAALSAAPP